MDIISRLHTFGGGGGRKISAHYHLLSRGSYFIYSQQACTTQMEERIHLPNPQLGSPLSRSLSALPRLFQSLKCYHFTRETAFSFPDVLDRLMLQHTQISNLNCFFKDHIAIGLFPSDHLVCTDTQHRPCDRSAKLFELFIHN